MISNELFEPSLSFFPTQTAVARANGNPKTLIADDQTDVLAALHILLKSEGYQTETVTSPAA
ncbi:MAG: hypothetical protein J2P41_02940, partial [Blastocatellia bacterium]|nr:hypothetical protein [Blastocatellia bacterium]